MSIKVVPGSNIKDLADNDVLETTTDYTIDGNEIKQVQTVATVSGTSFTIRNGVANSYFDQNVFYPSPW